MTSETPEDSHQDRLEQLEKRIEYLESVIRNLDPGETSAHESSGNEHRETSSDPRNTPGIGERFSQSFSIPAILKENWLYWIGVALLLLGVVFLFNYSIEQGWLIPPIRSAFGLLIGSALFWLGFSAKIGGTIRQFLMGAGIGAFYITGFATFQLYSFISYPVAFSFMIAVTVLSFGSSIRQNSSTLALIGTLGGLATPFMLFEENGSLLMLMIYSCIIMSGAAAIYQLKSWGAILWGNFIGGSLVLLVALATNVLNVTDPLFTDRWILQSGLLYMLGLVWLLPVVQELKNGPFNGMMVDPSAPKTAVNHAKQKSKENPHIQALTLLIPILAVQFTHGVWSFSDVTLGILALVGSVITASLCIPLQRAGFQGLSNTHLFSSLVLFTQAMFLFFDGNMLLVVVTLEALALRYAATRFTGKILSLGSHLLIVAAWLLMAGEALFSFADHAPILNMQALSELLVLVATGGIIPLFLGKSKTAGFYKLIAHIGVLAWLAKELTPLDNGQMLTSVGWAIYSILVLLSGFWLKRPLLRSAGMVTILIVVVKLFFVDLSQTSALLRIPLFMGFGAVLLLTGYILQKYWTNNHETDSGDT